jgi:hypothetical protein
MHKIVMLKVVLISFFLVSRTQAADFRFGFEHGVLFPITPSLYDGSDSVQFPGFKEGLYWPSGWGIELTQRLISPQNRFLAYAIVDGVFARRERENGGTDRYHLQYNLPLVLSLRYDFQRNREALFRPYLTAGLGLYYTVRYFERTNPPEVIERVDRQAPIGPMFTAGLELLRTRIKIITEFKYEGFILNETFEGSGDNGTGGGASLSLGVIF